MEGKEGEAEKYHVFIENDFYCPGESQPKLFWVKTITEIAPSLLRNISPQRKRFRHVKERAAYVWSPQDGSVDREVNSVQWNCHASKWYHGKRSVDSSRCRRQTFGRPRTVTDLYRPSTSHLLLNLYARDSQQDSRSYYAYVPQFMLQGIVKTVTLAPKATPRINKPNEFDKHWSLSPKDPGLQYCDKPVRIWLDAGIVGQWQFYNDGDVSGPGMQE